VARRLSRFELDGEGTRPKACSTRPFGVEILQGNYNTICSFGEMAKVRGRRRVQLDDWGPNPTRQLQRNLFIQ
jgi:hypothetical protein